MQQEKKDELCSQQEVARLHCNTLAVEACCVADRCRSSESAIATAAAVAAASTTMIPAGRVFSTEFAG